MIYSQAFRGPCADAQASRDALRALRAARRILTRNGVEAAATHVQLAIDIVDPRTPRIAERLGRGLFNEAESSSSTPSSTTVRPEILS